MSSSLRIIFSSFRPSTLPVFRSFSSSPSTASYSSPNQLLDLANILGDESVAGKASRIAKNPISRDPKIQWKDFQPNRVLKPHDLTYDARVTKPRVRTRRAAVGPAARVARYNDVFHQFRIDPLSQAQNPAILNDFISDMGKIFGRNITGLTSRSQRRVGKAVRRAKMMGIIPILSRPKLLNNWKSRS